MVALEFLDIHLFIPKIKKLFIYKNLQENIGNEFSYRLESHEHMSFKEIIIFIANNCSKISKISKIFNMCKMFTIF